MFITKVKSPSVPIDLTPFTFPYLPLAPFPPVLLSVSVSFVCLFVLLVCCFQFHIPRMSEVVWFLTYFAKHDILKSLRCCCTGQSFSLGPSRVALHVGTTSPSASSRLSKATGRFCVLVAVSH